MTYEIRNNEAASRFETTVDGHTAVAEYTLSDGVITLTHTEVPGELSGRGIAAELVKHALEHARSENLGVVPQCAYVAAYIRRNPEYGDLVRE